jgi:hypothetical protein
MSGKLGTPQDDDDAALFLLESLLSVLMLMGLEWRRLTASWRAVDFCRR